MEISINGNTDFVSPIEGSTFGLILGQLRELLRDNQLIAVELKLDGDIVTLKQEAELAAKLVDDYISLEVTARDVHTVCLELLDTLDTAIDPLIDDVKNVAGALQNSSFENMEDLLSSIITRFVDLKDGLSLVCTFNDIDIEEISIDGDSFDSKAADMKNILLELQQNITDADVFALAETLEFEFAEQLTEWKRISAVVRESLGPQTPDDK